MKSFKLALATAAVALAPVALAQSGNWNLTVKEDEVSHRIGNPDAQVTLTEYVSYTCSHCATFAREGDPVLELAYIGSGKVAVEYRQLLRNPIDLTISMMTHCGDPLKFKQNHAAFMLSQEKWLGTAQGASQAQIARWTQPGAASRRNIANDFGFYEIMKQRGYRITDLDKCLNNEAQAKALADATQSYARDVGVRGTPSFAINGRLVEGAHSWPTLNPKLDEALFPENSSQNGK
ncbi:DsbA family protein [Altererythrobacter sp. GH1-8]|uniref:DsbA family protein n=1 Tax=Altererythrobacter sp. GH1-8 TaxID=3349333 RepID=UPI00374D57CC